MDSGVAHMLIACLLFLPNVWGYKREKSVY